MIVLPLTGTGAQAEGVHGEEAERVGGQARRRQGRCRQATGEFILEMTLLVIQQYPLRN